MIRSEGWTNVYSYKELGRFIDNNTCVGICRARAIDSQVKDVSKAMRAPWTPDSINAGA